jgi:hypothetical protein
MITFRLNYPFQLQVNDERSGENAQISLKLISASRLMIPKGPDQCLIVIRLTDSEKKPIEMGFDGDFRFPNSKLVKSWGPWIISVIDMDFQATTVTLLVQKQ